MKDNFNECFKLLMISEGGYSNHKDDPGGKTKFGITEQTWIDYNKSSFSRSNLRIADISQTMAKKVYKKEYWDKSKCEQLPPGVDYCVFDAGVHSGVPQSVKWLQQCVRVKDDGIIGKDTLKECEYCLPWHVIDEFCNIRLIFLKSLKTWEVFGKGWNSRVESVKEDSIAMLK